MSLTLIAYINIKLNGKKFQDSVYSVSLARPKKVFNRNSNFNSNYDRSTSRGNDSNNQASASTSSYSRTSSSSSGKIDVFQAK